MFPGGHSKTFLSKNVTPSIERSSGNYPYLVRRGDHDVPFVQEYKFSKYIGRLDLRKADSKKWLARE